MLVVGSMIGSGIFIVSAESARLVGTGGRLLAVWAAAGALTLLAALACAELATMFPEAGGPYVFFREAYGRWRGSSTAGRWRSSSRRARSPPSPSRSRSSSASSLRPLNGWTAKGAAALVVLVLTATNAAG